jgi:protein SCO1/2
MIKAGKNDAMVQGQWGALLVVALLVLAGCRSEPASPQRRYPLQGAVVAIDRASAEVTIQHGEIPGVMQAMTMPYRVQDPTVLGTLQSGQHVKATLVVDDNHAWLENIETVEQEVVDQGAAGAVAPALGAVHVPTPGDVVPDFAFINQDGWKIHLGRYKGKVLVVTFVYTRCPMPDFCPRMMKNFQEIEKKLKQDAALFGETRLLTITIDPKFDTAKVMRSYALRSTGIPAEELFSHWEFLTPRVPDLGRITTSFGLSQWPQDGQLVHSLSTVVVDPAGKIFSWHRGNEWTSDDILRDVRTAVTQH